MHLRVRLLGVPAHEFVRLQRQVDDLARELEIIEVGASGGSGGLPVEARRALRTLLARYARERASARAQAEAAVGSGRTHVDVELDLPVEAANAVRELVGLLDGADALSRDGLLLTVPPSADLVALRRWAADEVWRQLREGLPPRPYQQ